MLPFCCQADSPKFRYSCCALWRNHLKSRSICFVLHCVRPKPVLAEGSRASDFIWIKTLHGSCKYTLYFCAIFFAPWMWKWKPFKNFNYIIQLLNFFFREVNTEASTRPVNLVFLDKLWEWSNPSGHARCSVYLRCWIFSSRTTVQQTKVTLSYVKIFLQQKLKMSKK